MLLLGRASLRLGLRPVIRPGINHGLKSMIGYSPMRFNSNKINKVEKVPDSIMQRIPGESIQTNELKDRLPSSIDFKKDAVTKLLPRPGVPISSKTMTLRKMVNILRQKPAGEPELIYESESHGLYFVICYCFGLVFLIYGINTFYIGFGFMQSIYERNELQLDEFYNSVQYYTNMAITVGCGICPLLVSLYFLYFPQRLIRRMWYIPAKSKKLYDGHVRFSVHPLLPNRPTPLITIPLSTLNKNKKARIFTGDGFYGTNDRSTFFFFLFEDKKKLPWIVDRKGFFWGDGRVFDLIFGKETVEVAEEAKTYDSKFKDLIELRKEREAKLKKELGVGWRLKSQGKLMLEDINKVKSYIGHGDPIKVGKSVDEIIGGPSTPAKKR